jgi:hypothetical protein
MEDAIVRLDRHGVLEVCRPELLALVHGVGLYGAAVNGICGLHEQNSFCAEANASCSRQYGSTLGSNNGCAQVNAVCGDQVANSTCVNPNVQCL